MKLFDRIKGLSSDIKSRAGLRKTKVAGDLSILISLAGLKRKDVAQRLQITEAALSIRLNGTSNLTLESIGSICDVAGLDFDVSFRKPDSAPALSYWELDEPTTDVQLSEVNLNKVDVDPWLDTLGKGAGLPHYSVRQYQLASETAAANDCVKLKYAS